MQFINVHRPKQATAKKFWLIVHNSMIFSIVLTHAHPIAVPERILAFILQLGSCEHFENLGVFIGYMIGQ